MLPVEYQKRGIGIGDVGIITDYGAFDYLFNIRLPQNHPINPEDIPEDFYPLHPPLSIADIHGYSAFKVGSHLASGQVETFQQDRESSGLTFESSASEGAILTMPCGSNSTDLRNLFRFRKYALANAEKWYRYANEIRGREAKNGDVRLVIGYDSTTAWGMATFANLSEHRYSRLKFKPIGESSLGRIYYGWEYSGITMAEVRSGPDFHEVEKLRNLDQAEEEVIYENQCLFVRTLNITLQNDVWNKLAGEWEMFYLGDKSEVVAEAFDPSAATRNFSFGTLGAGLSGGEGASDLCMQEDREMLRNPQDTFQRRSAFVSYLPLALEIHPSQVINEFLLKERPDAKDDKVLPSPEILLDRIRKCYDIYEEGMVFLQLKNLQTQAEGLQSACLDLAFKLNPEPEISPVLSSFQNINNLTPAQAAACETSPPSSPIPSVVSPFGRTNNAPGLTIVGAPDAMKVFRRNFNWLPLSKKGNYQIFKSGIPMWKLSVDGHGGHWALILRVKANPQQGERSSSPHTGRQAVKTQRASKEKLVQVTPVGMIVVQDDTVYKLPWGCW